MYCFLSLTTIFATLSQSAVGVDPGYNEHCSPLLVSPAVKQDFLFIPSGRTKNSDDKDIVANLFCGAVLSSGSTIICMLIMNL